MPVDKDTGTPKVSIIIPAYNAAQYLEECVSSAMTQDIGDFELLIIDDGSTDGTWAIMQGLAEKYSNIRIFTQENKGQGSARNVGIQNARGEAIAFLDADDYLGEGILQATHNAMVQEGCDIVIFNGTAFFEEDMGPNTSLAGAGEMYFKLTALDEGEVMHGLAFTEKTKGRIQSPCMKIYRRALLHEHDILFPEGGFGEDSIFFFDVMARAGRVTYLHRDGYRRRYHQMSTMTQTGIQNVQNRIRTFSSLEDIAGSVEDAHYHRVLVKLNLDYACLLWVMAMNRHNKEERTTLLDEYWQSGVAAYVKKNKLDFTSFVFFCAIYMPKVLFPVQWLFAKTVKLLLKNKTRFAI